MGAYFSDVRSYFHGKAKGISEFQKEFAPGVFDAEIKAVHRLALADSSAKLDDRKLSVEVQIDTQIDLKVVRPLAVVAPLPYFEDNAFRDHVLNNWKCELISYPVSPLSVSAYYALIFKTPVHSNAWIDVYLALVKKHPDDRDLRELGFGWLKEEAGGLRRWPEVYDAVVGSNSDEASKTLLVEWLLRANTEMKSWPKAAASFLKANPDNAQVREAVQKWLAQKPDRVEAWDLGALINTEITA